jgi:group I intron endonuclease
VVPPGVAAGGKKLIVSVEASKAYRHILKYMSWPYIVRAKKHISVDHCRDIPNNILSFRNKWNGISGIYKITFLPFRLFTYYGSSFDLGMRFKYHYYNGAKQRNFLGFFLKTFGWTNFAITVIEISPKDKLGIRENWYLTKYQPILNVLKSSGEEPRQPGIISRLTRSKISETLKGRKDSEVTRAKKSVSRKGILNPFYRKGPGIKALDIAAEKAGTKIYVYDITNFSLVNNKPFRSILPKGVRQMFYLFQLIH